MNLKYKCYWGEIPEEFSLWLINRYKTPYCTVEYNRLFCETISLNCFSIYDDDTLVHLIIFGFEPQYKKINILNRVFELDIEYLNLFSNYIFNTKLQIDKIQINHLINPLLYNHLFPSICTLFDEDYVIKLPGSTSEYISRLSSNMRRHTKNYISKIERTFGNYSFNIFEKDDVSEEIINKIVKMNHLRMNAKNIVSGIDQSYANKIIRFAQNFGFISVFKIDGEIVAGLISYSIGNNYFVEEISSDPQYDKFDVGHTCLFLTIQDCISRGGKEFHLLWGNSSYKSRFLAERCQLYSVSIFRTHYLKQKHRFINELLPCMSAKYLFKIFKRKMKKILGR
ncbi:MAG: GNAT family N-acetyltransferase [Paludibacteraceae bacterium]|nr:GNAT family N-acetyltransferase [Paludibacteraceae bacterium]